MKYNNTPVQIGAEKYRSKREAAVMACRMGVPV